MSRYTDNIVAIFQLRPHLYFGLFISDTDKNKIRLNLTKQRRTKQNKNKNDIAKMSWFDLDWSLVKCLLAEHLPAHMFESNEVGKGKKM